MRLFNPVRERIASALLLLAAAALLASCATNPASKTYTAYLTGSANPIGVQSGRLMVVTLDNADGGPLMRASVEVVAADATVREPRYYKRVGISDERGMVTFTDVPKLVNVSIVHPRGTYSLDNYVVPQTGTSEFRVYIDTTGPRTRDECLGFALCGQR